MNTAFFMLHLAILIVLMAIGIQVAQLHDSIVYDYRPTVRCINNNAFECPVQPGATLIINETQRGE